MKELMNQLGIVTPEYSPKVWHRLQGVQNLVNSRTKTEGLTSNKSVNQPDSNEMNSYHGVKQEIYAVNDVKMPSDVSLLNVAENVTSLASGRTISVENEPCYVSKVQLDIPRVDKPEEQNEKQMFSNNLDLKRPLNECDVVSERKGKKRKSIEIEIL